MVLRPVVRVRPLLARAVHLDRHIPPGMDPFTWAEQHLPRFIEEDARERYDKLPLRAQQAVVAGSLRGSAFAQSSVSILLRPSASCM